MCSLVKWWEPFLKPRVKSIISIYFTHITRPTDCLNTWIDQPLQIHRYKLIHHQRCHDERRFLMWFSTTPASNSLLFVTTGRCCCATTTYRNRCGAIDLIISHVIQAFNKQISKPKVTNIEYITTTQQDTWK